MSTQTCWTNQHLRRSGIKIRGRSHSRLTCAQAHGKQFEEYVLNLQSDIKARAESIEADGGHSLEFIDDRWERDGKSGSKGYGITSVLEGGTVLEKAAANVSVIKGTLSKERAAAMSSRGRSGISSSGGDPYSAVAMSLVFHSAHPFIPTLRADVRMFEVGEACWFGGGCDLTPNYLRALETVSGASVDLNPDIRAFHESWKSLCNRHSPDLYAKYKSWCDKYFYIPCRQEHRGTGGIFFDDLDSGSFTAGSGQSSKEQDPETGTANFDAEAFTRDVGENILCAWSDIVNIRRHLDFSDEQRQWQELRRGRYIEFNLLYDRGVRFGLEGGRIESIMVSAPPQVRWQYMKSVNPQEGSPEWEMLQVLRTPRDWV